MDRLTLTNNITPKIINFNSISDEDMSYKKKLEFKIRSNHLKIRNL
jgi:hypothetical protein